MSLRPNRFKGSTSARFVKNEINTNYRNTKEYRLQQNSQVVDPYVANNPMLNESVQRKELVQRIDNIDSLMGFDRFDHGENDGNTPRKGWLINFHATTIPSDEYLTGYSGVDYYFLDEEGGSFKATLQYDPYFSLMYYQEIMSWRLKNG